MAHTGLCVSIVLALLTPHFTTAQLGIGGSQSDICTSGCGVAKSCVLDCTALAQYPNISDSDIDAAFHCACQASCLEFMGICMSCCDASTSFTRAGIPIILRDCGNHYGKVPDERASIFSSVSFMSASPLPSDEASWVEALPSPSGVTLYYLSSSSSSATYPGVTPVEPFTASPVSAESTATESSTSFVGSTVGQGNITPLTGTRSSTVTTDPVSTSASSPSESGASSSSSTSGAGEVEWRDTFIVALLLSGVGMLVHTML